MSHLDEDLEAGIPLTNYDEPNDQSQALASSSHPTATFFHLFFKISAVVIYILNPTSFVLTFVMIVLCLAFDFWTVKNVTGRLLVGLRWTNKVTVKPNTYQFIIKLYLYKYWIIDFNMYLFFLFLLSCRIMVRMNGSMNVHLKNTLFIHVIP